MALFCLKGPCICRQVCYAASEMPQKRHVCFGGELVIGWGPHLTHTRLNFQVSAGLLCLNPRSNETSHLYLSNLINPIRYRAINKWHHSYLVWCGCFKYILMLMEHNGWFLIAMYCLCTFVCINGCVSGNGGVQTEVLQQLLYPLSARPIQQCSILRWELWTPWHGHCEEVWTAGR